MKYSARQQSMKYFLILYMYSINKGASTLIAQKHVPIEYPTYYDCLSDAYIRGYNSVMELGPVKVNQDKLLITFNCEEKHGISS